MNSSEQSINRLGDPTFFLEGVVHEKSDMVDFEGPLSLILLLLSKNKIEIRDIPIAEITDQYLEYLNAMEKLDLDIASEFVQMASYLLYIKTRMLLTEEKEISELEQLIASLEQLKAKDTYTALKSVLSVFTRGGASAAEPLVISAPKRITYSVRQKSRDLIDLLRSEGAMTLKALYLRCESRSEIVATFLSVLELCSLGSLRLTEEEGGYVASFKGSDEKMEDILDTIAESVGEE